jgi:O-antigen ligase
VFYDAAQFGNACAFFLIGAAAAVLRGRERSMWTAVAAVALIAGLIFSFSRGAMLSAGAGLLLLAALSRPSARVAAGGVAVLGASVGAALLAAPELTSTYALRFAYTAWRAVADPAEALGVRLESWSELLGMLADHPERLVFGWGYRTLPLIVDNQWLSTLGETGLVGLAALAALIGALLHGSWRAARSANPDAAFLGIWSLCFWAGQFVQMLFVDLMTYWRVLPVYMVVLALAEREHERRPA